MIVLRFRFEIAIKNRNKKKKIELKLNLSHWKNFEFLVAMKRAHTFQSQLEIADWARITWVHFLDGYRSHTIVETREYCKSRNNVKKNYFEKQKKCVLDCPTNVRIRPCNKYMRQVDTITTKSRFLFFALSFRFENIRSVMLFWCTEMAARVYFLRVFNRHMISATFFHILFWRRRLWLRLCVWLHRQWFQCIFSFARCQILNQTRILASILTNLELTQHPRQI